MSIRNCCLDNTNNQQFIESLKVQGVVPLSNSNGVSIDIDTKTGKFQFKKDTNNSNNNNDNNNNDDNNNNNSNNNDDTTNK